MEHRVGTRYPVSIAADVEHRRLGSMKGRISNASVSGLYLEVPSLHERGVPPIALWFTPVRLRFRLPGGEGEPTREWRGFVTRVDGDGLAATNASSDPLDRSDVIALIEFARERTCEKDREAA